MYREELTDLGSVMRSILRAAGASGSNVDFAAECASTAAQLWFDGEHEQIKTKIPDLCRKIRDACKSAKERRSRDAKPAEHNTEQKETADNQKETRYLPLIFTCHGEADALILATDYKNAVAKFMDDLKNFITIINVTNLRVPSSPPF